MKDRIHQLMQSRHMNQQAFANHTGIATASLSNIFGGRTRPTLMHVDALKKAFPDLNLEWLISGTGEMFTTSGSGSTSTVPGATPSDAAANTVEGDLFSSAGGSSVPSYGTDKMAEPLLPFGAEQSSNSIGQNFHSRQSPAVTSEKPVQYSNSRHVVQPVSIAPVVSSTPARKITEIRVYYDDQTWESFVPKK